MTAAGGGSGRSDRRRKEGEDRTGGGPWWRFPGWVALLYGLFLVLWIPFGGGYRAQLIGAGNLFFAVWPVVPGVVVRHQTEWPRAGVSRAVDLAVCIRSEAASVAAGGREVFLVAKAVATRAQPYAAAAFLIALVLAPRRPWRERLLQASLGLLLLHGLMLGIVVLDVVQMAAASGLGRPIEPEWLRNALLLLHLRISDWPAGVFVVPLVLWMSTDPWVSRSLRGCLKSAEACRRD